MALYTVAAGDSIWNIADRSLGLRDGRSAAPPSNQEIVDEMLRIIATNIGKLKVPKGSKGTPGAADLIHAGLVLDLGGAPSPSEAAKNGQQSGGDSKDPGGSMSGYNPPAQNSAPSGGREPGPQPNPGAPSGGREPGPARNPGNPTGGREPGWGGRSIAPNPGAPSGGREPGILRNPGAPTGGREPGWGGRDNGPQREIRPVSPQRNLGSPTGGREPGWGGRTPNPGVPNPGWGGREPANSNGRNPGAPSGGREPGPVRNSSPWGGREPARAPSGRPRNR